MWTLENDGDLLDGKRMWLRPGRRYLFGRSKKRERGLRLIDDKSISRHHLAIEVKTVETDELEAKSALTVEELGTKYGTTLDGIPIRDSEGPHLLKGDEHVLKLGRETPLFRIKWQPVVLTLSASSYSEGTLPDFASLDIRSSTVYNPLTSHVVAAKRNTTKGLQALIDGRFIVGTDFITALQEATTVDDDEYCPLEKDFDAAWPSEIDYLPGPGKEPGNWPAEKFMPDPRRKTVFAGFSFLSFHKAQYDSLLDVIKLGGGRSILLELMPGRSTAADAAQFARSKQDGGQVVVVQHNSDTSSDGWYRDTAWQTASLLDRKIIEQNEFLEAILVNSKKVFDKAFEKREIQPVENKAEKKRAVKGRQIVTSRFRGFDDSFTNAESQPADTEPEPEPEPEQSRARRPRESTDNEALTLDNMLPGIAAKRRRIGSVEPQAASQAPVVKQEGQSTRSRKQDSEVIKAAKQHTQAIDEADRRKRADSEALLDEDTTAIQKVVTVETFEVRDHSPAVSSNDGRWAGRKNFKAFKRKGTARSQPPVEVEQHEPAARQRNIPSTAPSVASVEVEATPVSSNKAVLEKVNDKGMRSKGKRKSKIRMNDPEEDDSDSDELRFKFVKKAR